MSQVSPYLRRAEGDLLIFWCPGCQSTHQVHVGPGGWGFNGDLSKPTFTPSVLVRSGHYMPERKSDRCWCTFNAEREAKGEKPAPFRCTHCHSFVTDGQIQFLGDCSHALAGQTVPLPELPEHLQDPAQ